MVSPDEFSPEQAQRKHAHKKIIPCRNNKPDLMAVSLFGIPGNDVNRSLLLLVNEYYHNTDTTLVNGITDPEHDKTIVVAQPGKVKQ